MTEDDIRRIVREELEHHEAKEKNDVIESDEFKVLKGDIASAFESTSGKQFPWNDPFVSSEIGDRLFRLIKRGFYKEHPGWLRERNSLLDIVRINCVAPQKQ